MSPAWRQVAEPESRSDDDQSTKTFSTIVLIGLVQRLNRVIESAVGGMGGVADR